MAGILADHSGWTKYANARLSGVITGSGTIYRRFSLAVQLFALTNIVIIYADVALCSMCDYLYPFVAKIGAKNASSARGGVK